MTQAEQSEALRLAEWLVAAVQIYPQRSEDDPGGYASEVDQVMDEAAAELRRLYAENTTLQQGYDAARLEIESLHARVQELELERERAVAAEREACAKLVQDMSHHRRWVRAGINGEPIRPCEYAAAIHARGAQGESNG